MYCVLSQDDELYVYAECKTRRGHVKHLGYEIQVPRSGRLRSGESRSRDLPTVVAASATKADDPSYHGVERRLARRYC